MMLVGTSLGGCLRSLLAGEVSEQDVLMIIAHTSFPSQHGLDSVVNSYFPVEDDFAANEEAHEIARRLYEHGKIHQPRLFTKSFDHLHPEIARLSHTNVWLNVAPVYAGNNEAVINAYERYRMLALLVK